MNICAFDGLSDVVISGVATATCRSLPPTWPFRRLSFATSDATGRPASGTFSRQQHTINSPEAHNGLHSTHCEQQIAIALFRVAP